MFQQLPSPFTKQNRRPGRRLVRESDRSRLAPPIFSTSYELQPDIYPVFFPDAFPLIALYYVPVWLDFKRVSEGSSPKSWEDRLVGMQLSIEENDEHEFCSTLVGRLRDQAELNGVLQSLYHLHLNILSVTTLADT